MVHENNIKQTLDQLGCPQDVFCILVGMNQSRWSRAVRGIKELSGPEAEQLLKFTAELCQLAHDAAPIPVNFRDPQAIGKLLESRRAGIRWISSVIEMNKEEQAVRQ